MSAVLISSRHRSWPALDTLPPRLPPPDTMNTLSQCASKGKHSIMPTELSYICWDIMRYPAARFPLQCAFLLLALMRTSSCNRAGDAVFVDGLQVWLPFTPRLHFFQYCYRFLTFHNSLGPIQHQRSCRPWLPLFLSLPQHWQLLVRPSHARFRAFHDLGRFEFGSAVTVELWMQPTRVFFGTSIMAGVIGCLVWQVLRTQALPASPFPNSFNSLNSLTAARWPDFGVWYFFEQRQRFALGGGAFERRYC